jgi:hypothetical protein
VPGGAASLDVRVVERLEPQVECATRSRLLVTTGLLSALSSDAQLAMVIGHALAREADTTTEAGGARRRTDDEAVAAALRAVVAAGLDGREAVTAWDALARATPLRGEAGSLADDTASRRRRLVALRTLRRSGQRATAESGHGVGRDAYGSAVFAHLDGWRWRAEAVQATREPEATAAAWLTYDRSGGITGDRLVITIGASGEVTATSSRRRDDEPRRRPLARAELADLRARVEHVLAQPQRQPRPEAKLIRDGQVRTLRVVAGDVDRQIVLSDGYELAPGDTDLLHLLESLAGREPMR